MTVLIPDVSEFQTVDFRVFSGPIIVRAHNSNRADNHWAQHADGASRQPWWAAYQYLTASADPAAAARAFLATLGDYRPNCTILDLEEGDGDQRARQHAWLDVMANDPARDWTYSGDYFARAHGLELEWVAAYQSREPTTAHQLWQFSDAHAFAGIGVCDASTFSGSVADLVALTGSTGGLHMDADVTAAFQAVRTDIASTKTDVDRFGTDLDTLIGEFRVYAATHNTAGIDPAAVAKAIVDAGVGKQVADELAKRLAS